MGVRGLTTYIERNKEKYLRNHRLRDTHLVIDGNSLCAQLYKYQSKCNDVFGGDYDKFARCIEHFFTTLRQCNITAIVILDGGYETRKLKTVNSRLKNKLKIIRNYGPICADAATVFPLFLREAFKDTLLKLNVSTVRCDYEADLDIACVARKLRCPVLSYDSDFYIFDVQYIPFTTLDHHVTKLSDSSGSKYCICCKIYEVHRFLRNCGLDKTHLPLMATMLGNDYIKKGVFRKFYNQIKLPKRNGCRSGQYRSIIAVIEWLKSETFDSAVRKILGRLKRRQRFRVAKKIVQVTEGYVCEYSELFEYLGLKQISETKMQEKLQINAEDIQSEAESTDDNNSVNSESDNGTNSEECVSEADDVASDCSDESSVDHINSDWFKRNFRTGNFPTLYIDVLTLNMCIYTPQVEDTTNLYTLEISLPVLRAICKILLQDASVNFAYLARNERSRIKKYNLQVSDLDLPKLSQLEGLSVDKSLEVLYLVLELTGEDIQKIEQLPTKWRLYFMSLVYWTRKSVLPKVTYAHVCATVLCLININIIDLNVPCVRTKTTFLKKYETQLKTLSHQTKKVQPDNVAAINELIQTVDTTDCLFFIDSLVANFTMDEKLTANKRLFALHIVDAFAQFQSCLFFVKYLNVLLNAPVENFDICQFYNGTFIYNLYANFEKRSDINSYIELLLKQAPQLLRVFKEIMHVIESLVEVEHVTINKKRRRRRKKDKNATDDKGSDNESEKEETSDTFNDVNNKFSILSTEN
ncbi:asteroid [Carabus blaptoides fortunei]